MRVTLLPREAAARVITGAIARLAWASGVVIMLLAMPVLIEKLVRAGTPEVIPIPLLMLVALLVAIVVVMRHMTWVVVVGYLVIASCAALIYELELINAAPSPLQHEVFLMNRPTLVLVTIGVAATTVLGGIAWCLLGYLMAWVVAVAAAFISETQVQPGFGPTIVLMLALVLYLTLFAIQAWQRRKLPNFDELEEATRRRAATADLAKRTTAIVHDTVLNDLAVIMNAPDRLDDHTRERLIADLDTLESGEWMSATRQVKVPNTAQAVIRNELSRVASEFRWRGLTVNVTGASNGVYLFEPHGAEALLGALRASFENVLRHSGATTANVEIMYGADTVSFMVSDEGVGFDPEAVDPHRLGMRDSIIGRMEQVGGTARIWSSPGAGTTVMLGVPAVEVREPSGRGEP